MRAQIKRTNPYDLVVEVARFRRAHKRLVRKTTEYSPDTKSIKMEMEDDGRRGRRPFDGEIDLEV